jgi:hypothetical protein
MATYNPCFLTVIGVSTGHPLFNGVIEKNFPDLEICNPNSEYDIAETIANMATKAYKSNAIALLLINGHGNENLENIKFEKCIIETKKISYQLEQIKNVFPDFKCNIIIQTCYSGNFPLCCNGILCSSNENNLTRNNLLTDAFSEVLYDTNTFSLKNIYDKAYVENNIGFNELTSFTAKSRAAWDFSDYDNSVCQNSELSIEQLRDCLPILKGNINDILIPVISENKMREAVKNITEENRIMSCIEILNTLEKINKCKYTLDLVEKSMSLIYGRPKKHIEITK